MVTLHDTDHKGVPGVQVENMYVIQAHFIVHVRLPIPVISYSSDIHHFHIRHKHLVYHPKLCTTFVLNFSWDDCNTQQKLETMVTQIFFCFVFFFSFGGGGGGGKQGAWWSM